MDRPRNPSRGLVAVIGVRGSRRAGSMRWAGVPGPGARPGRPGPSQPSSCAAITTVRSSRRRATAARTRAAVAASRWAVGSSRRTIVASRARRNARASAIRCRCPADSRVPRSPRRVAYPSGRAVTNACASACRAASSTAGAGRVRGAEADVVGDARVEQVGALGDVGDPVSPAVGRHVPERAVVDGDHARGRFGEPHQQAEQAGLAGSARPGEQGGRARPQHEVDAVERGSGPSGMGEGDAAQPDLRPVGDGRVPRRGRPARAVQDREHPLGRGDALHAGVEPRTHLAQRQVRLGREDEHEQRRLQVELPVEQAQPHLHGDERHRDRGQQLQHERRQERDAQRAHRRARGARRWSSGSARPPPSRAGGSPASGGPRRRRGSGRRAVPAAATAPGSGPASAAHQGHEHRDERQGQRDHERRDPVRAGDHDQHRDRDERGQDELGEVAGDVVVERVEAAGGQRRRARPRRSGPGPAAGRRRARPAAVAAADFTLAAALRSAADLGSVGQRGPAASRDDAHQRATAVRWPSSAAPETRGPAARPAAGSPGRDHGTSGRTRAVTASAGRHPRRRRAGSSTQPRDSSGFARRPAFRTPASGGGTPSSSTTGRPVTSGQEHEPDPAHDAQRVRRRRARSPRSGRTPGRCATAARPGTARRTGRRRDRRWSPRWRRTPSPPGPAAARTARPPAAAATAASSAGVPGAARPGPGTRRGDHRKGREPQPGDRRARRRTGPSVLSARNTAPCSANSASRRQPAEQGIGGRGGRAGPSAPPRRRRCRRPRTMFANTTPQTNAGTSDADGDATIPRSRTAGSCTFARYSNATPRTISATSTSSTGR